jgi:hypothetical protein
MSNRSQKNPRRQHDSTSPDESDWNDLDLAAEVLAKKSLVAFDSHAYLPLLEKDIP